MVDPNRWVLIVPQKAVDLIKEADVGWGRLKLRIDEVEQVVVVAGVWSREAYVLPCDDLLSKHYLATQAPVGQAGQWSKAHPDLHLFHQELVRRPTSAIALEFFKSLLIGGVQLSGDADVPTLTVAFSDQGEATIAAWWVTGTDVTPARCELVTAQSPVEFQKPHWPVDHLGGRRVTIVGVGSLGSQVADTLARYGIGRLSLFDHDRFSEHNIARHQLDLTSVGRFKVNAMADWLTGRWPHIKADRYPYNVSGAADIARPLFAASDVVVCAADGVTARKVSNHLARRAGVPLVLTSVKEFGALGEVIRVQPGTGCLGCFRKQLMIDGVMDPEPRLDRGYGTGDLHLPMTAPGGDLTLVGGLAAKVAIAAILERQGDRAQKLPGDVLTVGLRPVPGLAGPYAIEQVLDVKWTHLPGSDPNCPSCRPA